MGNIFCKDSLFGINTKDKKNIPLRDTFYPPYFISDSILNPPLKDIEIKDIEDGPGIRRG